MAGARDGIRQYLRRGVAQTPLTRVANPDRVVRAVGYGLIGVTGIPVDMLVTNTAATAGAHYLVATMLGYTLAMTWNFGWQRRYVFNSAGNVVRQYIRYLGVDVASGGVRVAIVTALMVGLRPETAVVAARTGRVLPFLSKHSVAPVTVASVAGIFGAFVVGFTLTDEYVFTGGTNA